MGFRRPACSPLTVVASELALGAMAYDGGGGAGAQSRSPAAAGWLGGLALSKATPRRSAHMKLTRGRHNQTTSARAKSARPLASTSFDATR